MKNKKVVLALAALILVIAVFAAVFFLSRPTTVAGAKAITVTVVHSDGTTRDFKYHTDEEFLGPVLIAEKLVVGEEGPYGLTILAVDGEEATWDAHHAYWALYIGEEYATTGADTTPIADGDAFRLVYTNG